MGNTDRLIELFNEARARPAGSERDQFVSQACQNDDELKTQVASLLRAHEKAGNFLTVTELRSPNSVCREKTGDRIGRYKLLQQLGAGGCGVVYMAEQEEPVRRRVALKVIKLGMDTKSVIARFEAERQALALMDHPNIAKVLDAGATEAGRPFFVMELVRGTKITDYCNQNNLTTDQRLEVFTAVGHAVQHAHQKGVIHRDLKPSNILVTLHDGAPVPKVIDFGIAKATSDQRLTDKTVFTAFEQFIGTPAYMSPEQAEMSSDSSGDIDTRSDVYSLGVLLYELLTGRTPLDAEELERSGMNEMRRRIREDEPPRPSTRLKGMQAGNLTRVARERQTEGPKLIDVVRGDLDWIVMKCLEKDRTRRYETAGALVNDIKRYLSDEPVTARPPSRAYQFQKLVRRNRVPFAAAGAVATILVAGIVVTTSQAVRARRAEREQSALRRQADSHNRDLRHTVGLLELRHAEDLLRTLDPAAGVAHLVALLRRDPSNHIAAHRLVSALGHRNWAVPAARPMRHEDRVMAASFSPEGRQVLSASRDKTARIWDAATGELLATVAHQDQIICARYSSRGNYFVTASADGTARVWSTTNGRAVTPPLRHDSAVHWAEFSNDGRSIVTAGEDKTAKIWDAATGELKRNLSAHNSAVIRAHFSPDASAVATVTESGTIRLWSASSGTFLFHSEGHRGRLNNLTFRPDGGTLASAGWDHTARLWNASNGSPGLVLQGHAAAVNTVAFSPDGQTLLTTSQDHTARLWKANGQPIGQPLLHEGDVGFGAFSPDGKTVVTTSWDNSARLWDARTGRLLCQPLRQHEAILHAGFSPDGQKLVTASWDQNVQVWDIQPRRFRGIRMGHDKAVISVACHPLGHSVLSASYDGTARLFDARTGQALCEPMVHQGAVRHAGYSADGERVVTASDDGTARVWDSADGHAITGPLQHAKAVVDAQFSPKEDHVVTASVDGTARVWDGRSGRAITPPLKHAGAVKMARYSSDGRWIVTAAEDSSAGVWDAHSGQAVTRFHHADHVQWAEFSPENRRVVSASSDNTARIWDAQTGRQIGLALRHARTVQKAVFSPDGRYVVTASLDRTARVWDATTGETVAESLMHDGYVSQVAYSRDGRRLLTSCVKGPSRLWDAATGRPLTEWLDAGGTQVAACLDETGRRLITGALEGAVHLSDEPPAPTPVPVWFLDFAEAVVGTRLTARGNTELVSRQELEDRARQLSRSHANDFYERLARWFLANPAKRPLAPF